MKGTRNKETRSFKNSSANQKAQVATGFSQELSPNAKKPTHK